jgi:Spy/CpxP family protein refolding chaperone
MKRNHRLIAAAALSGLLVAGAGSAFAFGKFGGPGGMAMGGQGAVAAAYQLEDLTPDQRTKLKALRDEARKQQAVWRENRQALRDAMLDGADAKTLRPLAEKQGQSVTERIMMRVKHREALNAILTDAQREKLAGLTMQRPRKGARPCAW